MKEKHPCHTKLCAFRCLISRPQNLILRSQNQIQLDHGCTITMNVVFTLSGLLLASAILVMGRADVLDANIHVSGIT